MAAVSALIERFNSDHRASLAAFAAQSPRFADLAETHPLAFIALATGHGGPRRRAAAIKAVLDGQRLRAVCDLAKIPFSLRKIPPELCPVPLSPATWSSDASPVLAQLIPDDEITLRNWVPAIFFANSTADEAFALWLAKDREVFANTILDHRRLLPLAMYCWFLRRPQHELNTFIPGRWLAGAGLRRHLNATRAWLYRICCRTHLPDLGADEQTAPFAIGPFQAFELNEFRTLLAEQQAMDNCLDRYGRRIASGSHALFSLRTHTGERVANFEVAVHAPDGSLVSEIRGRSNREVSDEIRQAVEHWVSTSPEIQRRPAQGRERTSDADDLFAKLIAPYVETHADILADCPPITLRSLEDDLDHLAVRLGVDRWPVRFERTHGARGSGVHWAYAPRPLIE